jgi:hypothetical protein
MSGMDQQREIICHSAETFHHAGVFTAHCKILKE